MTNIYQFTVTDHRGEKVCLANYKNKVLLIVNTASACGLTPQYEALEQLQQQYGDKGFTVLAFPCNQFKQQEPANIDEIKQFCDLNFNITFPLFNKIDVNGESAHPLFKFLTSQAKGFFGSKSIKWNFTKFLVSADGTSIKRYAPITKPETLTKDIEKLLAT